MRLSDLTELLAECIIRSDYSVPDEFNTAIAFTPYGSGFVQKLMQKYGVKQANGVPAVLKTKDVRLMCFLAFTHLDVLVDVMATDIQALEVSIGEQVLAKRIRYPFVFGRELYDRAADLFPTERTSLSIEETDELLDGTSPGVLQAGPYLLGPFGLLKSSQMRDISVYRGVPLFHCADADCDRVHHTELATDFDASVNQNRDKLRRLLDLESKESSAWGSFLSEISGYETAYFAEAATETLPFLLGDGLSDGELLKLAVSLAQAKESALTASLTTLPEPLAFERGRFTRTLNRAELLQLVLTCSDESIVSTLDNLVRRRLIEVPAGEIRRPKVNQGARFGAFALQAQLGEHGVAMRPAHTSVATARFRRLLDRLYEAGKVDESELDWQLRGVDAPERDDKLEEFFRNGHPREVLKRLVFSRYGDMVTASQELGIRLLAIGEQSDDELLDAIFWKLGFRVPPRSGEHSRFWRLHESLHRLTSEAGVSTLSDVESIRSVASNYFVSLEELLVDALHFSTWALLTDHYSENQRFVYDPDDCRPQVVSRLQDIAERNANEFEKLTYTEERNELFALCRGFALVAGELNDMRSHKSDFLRPEADWPTYSRHTGLQDFPFTHTVPFLDLSVRAQDEVVATLKDLSARLVNAQVSDVRNSYLHFRRSNAELDQMVAALEATSHAVEELERTGLARMLYRQVNMKMDEWGRSTTTLRSESGREVTFARPSRLDWIGLPATSIAQYVMPIAKMGEPPERLRFIPGESSEYSKMWQGYPRRRLRNEDAFVGDAAVGKNFERHSEIRQPVVAK
ncbi:hypothetical protein ACFVU2_13685 [Leifsonia sp. NPDC058194]|uniref:hypothetical protein n=1 Tax=Leifsonia sp. NPDC058194 TaxID=3346374 RepID=UPI0036D9776C